MTFWHAVPAIGLVIGLLASAPAAAAPPNGTISCAVFSEVAEGRPTGLLFTPFLSGTPQSVRFTATNGDSACDNLGVTGGKVPITSATFKLTARMSEGTCAALTSSAPPFEKARLKIKWRGETPSGKAKTVGSTNAQIASAFYDPGSHTLTMTTKPLTGGSFRGRTVTLALGFDAFGDPGNHPDYVAILEAGCFDGGFVGMTFGHGNAAMLDVH